MRAFLDTEIGEDASQLPRVSLPKMECGTKNCKKNMKKCIKCGVEKPLDEFHNHKGTRDRKRHECKECVREYHRDHYRLNIDYWREYAIRNKTAILASRRRDYSNNKERRLEYQKGYDADHTNEIKERLKKYYKTPQGKIKSARANHKRRSAMKNTECTLTAHQWQKIVKLQQNRCVICGKLFTKKNPATKDHIIPITKGGSLTFETVQAVHKGCNSKKSNKIDRSNIVVWISAPELCG